MLQLVIEQPGLPPITAPLLGDAVTLGRSEENDIVLSAEEVSRHHAKIWRKGKQTIVTDLNSLNGTYVNRQRISERVITHLDEIWFGSKCRIVFREDPTGESEEGASAEPQEAQQGRGLAKTIDNIREEMIRVGEDMAAISQSALRSNTTLIGESSSFSMSPEEVARMSRAYRRLDALYRAGQVITSNFDLQTRLSNTLKTIMNVLQANRGFVLLRDGRTQALHVKVSLQMGMDLNASSPSMGIAGRAAIDGEPVLMSDREASKEFGMRESIIANRINSAMCVPLKAEDRLLGSIYVDTNQPDMHFNEEDLELFSSLASQAAMAIDNVRLHEQAMEFEKRRVNLSRFLPGALVDKLMNESGTLTLGGTKSRVTTLFCDIRGSSQIAEQLSPQDLVALLNEHFTAMTEILFAYNGTLDKYIGDEIMAVFGAPIATGDEEYRAVCAAVEMQRCNTQLNALRTSENRLPFHVGIGIDSGEVIAGYIGSPKRMDFTVVGDRVNTAKRFCDMAGPGKIVVGQETWNMISGRSEAIALGAITLKGKQQSVQPYEIIRVSK